MTRKTIEMSNLSVDDKKDDRNVEPNMVSVDDKKEMSNQACVSVDDTRR